MADEAEIRRANFKRLWSGAWSPSDVVRRLGKSPSFWSDLYHGKKSFGEKLAREIEQALGLAHLALDDPHVSGGSKPTISSIRAHVMQDAPLRTWGPAMHQGSELFWVALPDDAMAPRAPAGKHICFDTRQAPRPGDGVLVKDAAGEMYFRVYRSGAGARWTAAAINTAFEPLDSERDGLTVVAVLKAEEGRWG